MNHIRVLFLSDTHLGFDYPIRPRVQRRRRGEDFFTNFQQILDTAIEKQVDLVIHGGDLFFRARIPKSIVERVYALLHEFSFSGIPIILLPGNHEFSRLPQSYRIDIPGIHLIESPTCYQFTIGGATIAVGGFPYHRKNVRSQFCNLVKDTQLTATRADILLLVIHQAVEGAQVGVQNYTFRRGTDVIRGVDIPSKVDAVLAGHIHRRQILKFKSDTGEMTPVIYSGSIERTSFAEKNEEKGFYIIEFSELNCQWKLTRMIFHSLNVRPMVELAIYENEFDEKTLDIYLKNKFKKLDQNSIVQLFYFGSPQDWLVKKMSAEYLRSVSPETMNITVSTRFYSDNKYSRISSNPKHYSQYRLDLFP